MGNKANAYFFVAWSLFCAFMGMAAVGIIYSTPMPVLAFIVLILLVVFTVLGIIEDA